MESFLATFDKMTALPPPAFEFSNVASELVVLSGKVSRFISNSGSHYTWNFVSLITKFFYCDPAKLLIKGVSEYSSILFFFKNKQTLSELGIKRHRSCLELENVS